MLSIMRFVLPSAAIALAFCAISHPVFAQASNDVDAFTSAGPLASSPEMLRKWSAAIEARPVPELPKLAGDSETEQPPAGDVADNVEGMADEEVDIVQLLAETHWHFNTDGSVRTTNWSVVHAFSADGATYASQLIQDWVPLSSDRPEMSARILTEDDREILNDGSGAFEQAASDGGGSIHTDARRLTLLLDGVEQGALVETKVVGVVRPLMDATHAVSAPLTDASPFRVHRLVITAAPGVSPSIRSIGPNLIPVENIVATDGSFRVVYQLEDPQSFYVDYESHCGPDRASFPMVIAALPGDWTKLATSYAASVKQALEEGQEVVKAIAGSAPAEVRNGTDRQKIDWCFNRVRQLIRYTGVEFGQQRIYPVSPAVVLARRFGDCKDQSTLLIGLLKEFGIHANIALLKVGSGFDTPADLPCLDWFNHAIVYVRSLDLWMDLTAEGVPPGLLTHNVYSRRALICDNDQSQFSMTPSPGADASVIYQADEYQTNLSGGGDLRVTTLCSGIPAVIFKLNSEAQPTKERIEYWKDFFDAQVGAREVRSLKMGAIGESGYTTTALSGRTQLLHAISGKLTMYWDVQRALDTLPPALIGYSDHQGQPVKAAARKHPMHVGVGETQIFEQVIHFPHALTAESLPPAFSRKHGLVSIELQVALSDRSVDEHAAAALKDLIKPELQIDPAYQAALNRSLRIRCTRRIEPGTMSVDESNACIEFLEEIRKELSGTCTLNWTQLSNHHAQPTTETFLKLVEQAKQQSILVDPVLAVAMELHAAGLAEFAVQQSKQFTGIDKSFRLSRNWVTLIRSTGYTDGGVPLTPDYEDIREFNRDHELELSNVQRLLVLQSAIRETSGMRSTARDKIQDAARLLRLLQTDNLFTEQDHQVLSIEQLMQGLALNDTTEIKAAISGLKNASYAGGVFEGLLNGTATQLPKTLADDAEVYLLRRCWELCVSAERFDLAFKLQELYPDPAIFLLPLPAAVAPKLASLNRKEPESVARHLLRDLLIADASAIKSSVVPETNIAKLLQFPAASPNEVQFWFTNAPSLRSIALVESVLELMPLEVISHGTRGAEVVFKNPYVDDAISQMRMLFVKDTGTDEWLAVPQEIHVANTLLKMLAAGETESVEALLNHILPPPKGLFGWFEDEGNRPHLRRLYYKIDAATDYRLPLLTRALLSESQNDLTGFEEWLKSAQLELPKSQLTLVDEFRESMFEKTGDYQKSYESCVALVEKNATFATVAKLNRVLLQDKLGGGEIHLAPQWRPLVEAYFENSKQLVGEQAALDKLLRVDYELINDNNDRAFEILKELLDSDSAKILRVPNRYLWRSLLLGVDRHVLQERYDEVLERFPLTEQENVAYLHTLACVEVKLGRVFEAMHKLRELTRSAVDSRQTENNLVRAMLLEELGFNEAAKDYYQRVIEANFNDDSIHIARNELKQLENELQSEAAP